MNSDMSSITNNQALESLESTFGSGHRWKPQSSPSAMVWELPAFNLLWAEEAEVDGKVHKLWEARKGRFPFAVVLLAPAKNESKVVVAGPQQARPIRELPFGQVHELLKTSSNLGAREAASLLTREFSRLEEAVVPGIRVKDLLTPHFVRERLRQPKNEKILLAAIKSIPSSKKTTWKTLFQKMGYRIDSLERRGYLLKFDNKPVAVVHPHKDPSRFSHLHEKGKLPEGELLSDCGKLEAPWGILTAEGRYRLFQQRPPIGAATGQYIEIDIGELELQDRLYLGLLTPQSLKGGWLIKWVAEAKDFGEELRKGLEMRLIKDALPNIAQGLCDYLESQSDDLNDSDLLRMVEEAALTLVFRFMFLLHTEARGYLPINSASYRPYSARQLAEDSRKSLSNPLSRNRQTTLRWDRLHALIRMIRTGDHTAGIPAYNGSLFAANNFPGSNILEKAEIKDVYLAPSLAAIAFESDESDAPGLDYAGLQIGHLGAIYETLLTLRLTRASEDLVYDTKKEVFRQLRANETPEVFRAKIYYQTEKGGRKGGGCLLHKTRISRSSPKSFFTARFRSSFERNKKTEG